jgi:hypothetical protein
MELYQDLGNRPLVFIRMNPDSYVLNGKRISSIFKLSKDGDLSSNKKELERRTSALMQCIESNHSIIHTRAISIEYLFFSED